MNRSHLHNHRLFVAGDLLQGADQLPQILDGVNVVMGGRGDGIRSLGNHPGFGHVLSYLVSGQMAADTGLCPLAHFDFNGNACVEIVRVYPKPSRGHLDNGVFSVAVKIRVKASFSCVVEGSQPFGSFCQTGVGVVADGAVAHGGKQHGNLQLQLGRQIPLELAVLPPLDFLRLLPQKYPGFHRLPKGVHRGGGHLGGVEENPVPVYRQGIGISHGGEQYTSGFRLTVNLLDGAAAPVLVFPEKGRGFENFQSMGGAEGHTPAAVYAQLLPDRQELAVLLIEVHPICALLHADAAVYAPGGVPKNLKCGIHIIHTH